MSVAQQRTESRRTCYEAYRRGDSLYHKRLGRDRVGYSKRTSNDCVPVNVEFCIGSNSTDANVGTTYGQHVGVDSQTTRYR